MGPSEEAGTTSWHAHLRRRLGGEGMVAVLVRGATSSAGANVLGAILALLAQLVLARLLGVSQYGYYVYAFTWVMVLAQLCRLGFQTSLTRFSAAYRAQADWAALGGVVRRGGQIALAASAVAAIGIVAVSAALAGHMPAAQVQTFHIAAVAVVPLTLLGITQGILRGYRRPARGLLPFRTFTHGGTLVLALAAGATAGLDTAAGAMGLTLAATVGALLVAGLWTRQAIGPDLRGAAPSYQTRLWMRISLPMFLMSGMHVFMKHTDTVLLGVLASTHEAGLYFPAARMSELAAFGLVSINAIAAPMITELYTNGQRERLQRLLTLAAIGTSLVTIAATAVFALAGHWALGLFGDAFPAAWPALMVLLAGQAANALCGPVGLLMTMTDQQGRASLVLAAGAMLNIVLNVALIPEFGLMGAAAATAISTAAWNLWMLVEVVRRHRLNPSVFARWPRLRL